MGWRGWWLCTIHVALGKVSLKQQKEGVPGEGQQSHSAFSYNHHLVCNSETQMDHVVSNQMSDPNLWKLEFEGPTLKPERAKERKKLSKDSTSLLLS